MINKPGKHDKILTTGKSVSPVTALTRGLDFTMRFDKKTKNSKLYGFKNIDGEISGIKKPAYFVCVNSPKLNQTPLSGVDYDTIPKRLQPFFTYKEVEEPGRGGKMVKMKIAEGNVAGVIKGRGGIVEGTYSLNMGKFKRFSIATLPKEILDSTGVNEALLDYKQKIAGSELRNDAPRKSGQFMRAVDRAIKAVDISMIEKVKYHLSEFPDKVPIGHSTFGTFYKLVSMLVSKDYYIKPKKRKNNTITDLRTATMRTYPGEKIKQVLGLVLKYRELMGEIPTLKYSLFFGHGLKGKDLYEYARVYCKSDIDVVATIHYQFK